MAFIRATTFYTIKSRENTVTETCPLSFCRRCLVGSRGLSKAFYSYFPALSGILSNKHHFPIKDFIRTSLKSIFLLIQIKILYVFGHLIKMN